MISRGQGGDIGAAVRSAADHGADLVRIERRQVALQIDHHVVARLPGSSCSKRGKDAVRAGGQVRVGQHRPAARRFHRRHDFGLGRRHHHRPEPCGHGLAQTRTIIGTPAISASGFARQPGRGHAGGDQQDRIHDDGSCRPGCRFRPGFRAKASYAA